MISPRLSAHLDLLRLAAALIVVLSHFAYPRFTDGDYLVIRTLNLGSDAVILFFVLSGFVIAHAAEQKDNSLGRFFFQRATRLYSVAVPAVLLTLACDRLGAALAPDVYDGWWYAESPAVFVLLHGLLFSNEWGPIGFRLGTNGPYWSLSYEAAYYILFGIAFYLRGLRRILLLALAIAAFGVKVLALMPAWLLGVAVYRALKADARATQATLWTLALAPPLAYAGFQATGLPAQLMTVSEALLGSGTIEALRFSDEFLWNGLLGILVALHVYGTGALLRGPAIRPRAVTAVRWLAGATFSLYLVHYPVMQLLDAVLPATADPSLRQLVLLGGTLAVCLVFAQLFERSLGTVRRSLSRLLRLSPAMQQSPRPS
jgi:peptidoglycan/LPS O-acetylase OafA/YrhL